MHPNDIIISCLTPGSVFNQQEKTWRSLKTLVAFTNLTHAEVLGILHGDLAGMVTLKPSKKFLGSILVALKQYVQAEGPPHLVAGGNAHVPPNNADALQDPANLILEQAADKVLEVLDPDAQENAGGFAANAEDAADF